MSHRTLAELTAYVDHLRAAPADVGTLDLLVRRPTDGLREVLDEGVLDLDGGLLGDNWLQRATARSIAEGRHLKAQINVMSARMVRLLADDAAGQAQAGDQLYLDLDLSQANLPSGTRLAIGEHSVIEVTDKPHNGCAKFRRWFGDDAIEFVNSTTGKELRLRGLNARVVVGGPVRSGDKVRKV